MSGCCLRLRPDCPGNQTKWKVLRVITFSLRGGCEGPSTDCTSCCLRSLLLQFHSNCPPGRFGRHQNRHSTGVKRQIEADLQSVLRLPFSICLIATLVT